jgi:hypothetical protein
MTTTIGLETSKGNLSLAFGLVLSLTRTLSRQLEPMVQLH